MSKFDGFGADTIAFLAGLSKNNDKRWFEAHRAAYEAHYIGPAKAFIEAAGPPLVKIAPNLSYDPRVNGSIFRINRDVRFSKDKTAYKDHVDLWFWEGERRGAASGFFLRIRADGVDIGAGAHMFDKAGLARFRSRASDPASQARLLAAVKKVERAGYPVRGAHYKKLPKGLEADGRAAELLRHNALWAAKDLPHPDELGSKAFVEWCTSQWRKIAPLHRWLIDDLRC